MVNFADISDFFLTSPLTWGSRKILKHGKHLKGQNLSSVRLVQPRFNHTNTKSKDKTRNFQVKKDEVKKLYEVYKNDFTLFDYDPTEFIDIASSE